MSTVMAGVWNAVTPLLVTGTDLMIVALLAFACFGLPGIVLMLYFQHRSDD
ncbi:hypothetical protein ACFPYI_04825 [Halomarina salina]|uniref:Photosystem II reaction center protein M n=1 Tax=Halomarina salina TaxID=1872699 RepID=A0ABD5RJQ4_9EURY|nr:hypothetical protein [Halomarina salina]